MQVSSAIRDASRSHLTSSWLSRRAWVSCKSSVTSVNPIWMSHRPLVVSGGTKKLCRVKLNWALGFSWQQWELRHQVHIQIPTLQSTKLGNWTRGWLSPAIWLSLDGYYSIWYMGRSLTANSVLYKFHCKRWFGRKGINLTWKLVNLVCTVEGKLWQPACYCLTTLWPFHFYRYM